MMMVSQLTTLVILASRVVESMSELMSCYSAECSVLEVRGPSVRVEWGLEDSSGEDDLSVGWS